MKDMVALFGGLRFRSMELFGVRPSSVLHKLLHKLFLSEILKHTLRAH